MLFGTIVGSLADKQWVAFLFSNCFLATHMSHYFSVSYYASYFEIRGRKRACVTYCITYIASCITKHSPQYRVLMLGRILGGIATSLLFSAFESWLVAEHFKVRKFYLFLKLSAVY
jgi:hypothetical protein